MIVSDQASVMLLVEEFFRSFTKNQICDTRTHTEGLFALSTGSRAEVDDMVGSRSSPFASDNLRKGAALNAVQIAELLGRRHLKKAA